MKTVLICVVLAFSAVLPGRAMSEQEVKVPSLWSWRAPAGEGAEHMRGVILLEVPGDSPSMADGVWTHSSSTRWGSAYLIAPVLGIRLYRL